jgi:tetratricopeptide (TPR) repeat protein
MIKSGAGWRVRIDKVNQFVSKYLNNAQYREMMVEAVTLLMEINSQFAYSVIFTGMCVATPEEGSVAIQGAESGEVYLLPGCAAQVLDKDGNFKAKEADQKGRRNVPVVDVFVNGTQWKMHLKEYPELSGRELVVGTLRRQLIGHGAPYTELFKFQKNTAKPYPAQFSKTVFGDNFHDVLIDPVKSDKVLSNLDHYSISGMIITSIFINPRDEQPANVIVELIKRSLDLKYRLECVDNDHGCVRSVAKDSSNKIQAQVISIFFCLDEMLKPIHADIIDQFLEYEAVEVMREWLKELIPKEECYGTLFTPEERKSLLAQGTRKGFVRGVMSAGVSNIKQNYQDNIKGNKTPSEMRILIPSEFIGTFYDKLRNTRKAFGKNPYTTGMQLLKLLMPEIGVMYESVFKTHKTPLGRFNALFDSHYSKVIAGQSFNSHRMLVSKLVATEEKSNSFEDAEIGPRQALELLEIIHKESQEIEITLSDLVQGQFDRFKNLQLKSHKEEIVNKIDWGSLKQNPDLQQKLLTMLCKEKMAFKRLKLSQCTSLKIEQLIQLLKNSPDLSRLDLSFCTVVDNATVRVLEKNAPNLEVLSIRGTLVDEWHCAGLPKLRRLMAQDCANLKSLKVSDRQGVPHSSFEMLVVDRSNKLSHLSIKSKAFKTFSCEGLLMCADRLLNSEDPINLTIKRSIQNYLSQMYSELAEQEYAANNFQKAIEFCDSATHHNDQNAKAFFIRASSHNAQDNIDDAISDFSMAIQLKYDNPSLFMLRDNLQQTKIGLSKYKKRDYSGAFSCFSRVIETDPTNAKVFTVFVNSGFEAKKYQRMLRISKNVVEVVQGIPRLKLDLSDEDRINSLFILGCANFHLGNFKEASSDFSAVIELVTTKMKALMESYNREAVRVYVDKSIETLHYIAQCEMELNNTTLALKHINKVLARQPRNIKAYIFRADCYLNLCDRDNFKKDYEKSLDLIEIEEKQGLLSEEAAAEAKYQLMIVYTKSAFRLDGDLEKAEWCAKALAASNPKRACLTPIECQILHAQGEFQLVLDSLGPILKQYPNKAELYILRAKSWMFLGSFENAKEDCDKALNIDKSLFESVLILGKNFIIDRQYDWARAFFKSVTKRFEDQPDKSKLNSIAEKHRLKYPYTLFLFYCYQYLALYFSDGVVKSTEVFNKIDNLMSTKYVTPPKLKEFLEANLTQSREAIQSEDATFEMQLQARVLRSLIQRIHLGDLAWYKILDISTVLRQYGFKNLNAEFDILLARVGESLQRVSSINKGSALSSSAHSMWSKSKVPLKDFSDANPVKGSETTESEDLSQETDLGLPH